MSLLTIYRTLAYKRIINCSKKPIILGTGCIDCIPGDINCINKNIMLINLDNRLNSCSKYTITNYKQLLKTNSILKEMESFKGLKLTSLEIQNIIDNISLESDSTKKLEQAVSNIKLNKSFTLDQKIAINSILSNYVIGGVASTMAYLGLIKWTPKSKQILELQENTKTVEQVNNILKDNDVTLKSQAQKKAVVDELNNQIMDKARSIVKQNCKKPQGRLIVKMRQYISLYNNDKKDFREPNKFIRLINNKIIKKSNILNFIIAFCFCILGYSSGIFIISLLSSSYIYISKGLCLILFIFSLIFLYFVEYF